MKENNTLSEDWRVTPDTRAQWSHAPMAALLAFPMVFAGIRPTAPAWRKMEIAPQLAGLGQLDLQVHTPAGPVVFKSRGRAGARALEIGVPSGLDAILRVAKEEALPLPAIGPGRYRLPAGQLVEVTLAHG